MAKKSNKLGNIGRSAKRNAAIAKLTASSGGRYGVHKVRKLFADPDKKQELDQSFQLKTAEEVTETFGNMKGAIMKIGQMASYLDTGLSDNVRNTLSSLQQDAPPMSGDLAASQIETELGLPPNELFLEWNPTPLASASIGQVHAAITQDGDPVAVKVQYPNIDHAISSDLKKADWLFKTIGLMFPGLDPKPVVEEIKERLTEELDYELEAKNQKMFANHFEGHPYIHVPRVYEELSSKRVLTSELVVGSTFAEALTWSEEEKNKLSETVFRFSFGAIYDLSSFNGDPHPGNYIFEGDGRVAFLDYGLVKHFQPHETKLFEDLINYMVLEADAEKFINMAADIGILSEQSLKFPKELIHEYFQYFYEYVLEDKVKTIEESYSAQGVERLFDMKGKYGELMKTLNIPPSFVVVQRITLGLMGIFGQLGATANWQAISRELWPFVEQQTPTTPMGHEIAEWEATKLDS